MMTLSWADQYDVQSILEILGQPNGKKLLRFWQPVLASAARFHPAVPAAHRLSFVQSALDEEIAQPSLPSADRFLSLLAKRQAQYLAQPEYEFILVAALSVACARLLFGRRHLASAHIITSQEVPRAYQPPALAENVEGSPQPYYPTSYLKARVHVRARSSAEADEKGFFALDALRGIWGFALGSNSIALPPHASSQQSPNAISLGPRYALYRLETKPILALHGSFEPPLPAFVPSEAKDLAETRASERWARRRLQSLKVPDYRERILQSFARYARAVDYLEPAGAVMSLWSMIENLTGTENARYDETIRRAASLFRHRAAVRTLLENLRFHRNDIVHRGRDTDLEEMGLIAHARAVVEVLFNFHLKKGVLFSSFQEACEFLHLPQDRNVLRRQIALRKLFLDGRIPLARFVEKDAQMNAATDRK
jgi:hypothetical protein